MLNILWIGSHRGNNNYLILFLLLFLFSQSLTLPFFAHPDIGVFLELPEPGETFAPVPSFVLPFLC